MCETELPLFLVLRNVYNVRCFRGRQKISTTMVVISDVYDGDHDVRADSRWYKTEIILWISLSSFSKKVLVTYTLLLYLTTDDQQKYCNVTGLYTKCIY